jgi:FdhD protein
MYAGFGIQKVLILLLDQAFQIMHQKGSQIKSGIKADNFTSVAVKDEIIVEEALQIYINGKPFTVTMRTPGNDIELIRGLLYTEDIYTGNLPFSYKIIDSLDNNMAETINVVVSPHDIGQAYYDSRSMMSVSSCGICGKKEWADIINGAETMWTGAPIESSYFYALFDIMKERQSLFHHTGGCHAAACFDLAGNLISIQEDIGRHNAVDKVIGDLLLNNTIDQAKIMLVSGRISYEIVSKTYKAKIPFLAAVSSPSSLSIKVAEELGMTLLAFCRKKSLTCYTHPERIKFPGDVV